MPTLCRSQKPSGAGQLAGHWRHFPRLHTNSNDGLRMTQKCLPRRINPPKSSLWPVISQPLHFFLSCVPPSLFIPKNCGMIHRSNNLVFHHHHLDKVIAKAWAAAAAAALLEEVLTLYSSLFFLPICRSTFFLNNSLLCPQIPNNASFKAQLLGCYRILLGCYRILLGCYRILLGCYRRGEGVLQLHPQQACL